MNTQFVIWTWRISRDGVGISPIKRSCGDGFFIVPIKCMYKLWEDEVCATPPE